MNDKLGLFLCGIIAGWFIASIINVLPFSYAGMYRSAIAECEKSIPRDKHCKVIGVINEQKN